MKKIYAVFDKAVSAYAVPFVAHTDAEASRMFVLAVARDDVFRSNAHDYSLCYLSEYNDNTGEFGVSDEEKFRVPRIVMLGTVAAAHAREMLPPLEPTVGAPEAV